jgi:hypothetical protein
MIGYMSRRDVLNHLIFNLIALAIMLVLTPIIYTSMIRFPFSIIKTKTHFDFYDNVEGDNKRMKLKKVHTFYHQAR